MQIGILEDILEIIPREDHPKTNAGGDGAATAGTDLKFKEALRERKFRFKLQKESYERIFKYLIDKQAVLRFQWCLEHFRFDHTMYPVIERYIESKLKQPDLNPIAKRGYLDCLARTHNRQDTQTSRMKYYETSLKMMSSNAFTLFERMATVAQPKEAV